jgi:hypothetical protein
MNIELSEEQVSLLLRVLGQEKARLNAGGFYAVAHGVSDVQAHIKNSANQQLEGKTL